ncbi:MAG: IMP dehydrogenase [Candidatus Kerfeldbacteria bacterium]|nr:IMP dehydrogenase [Candidatus Kerfeldbacteria bacterium]
MLKPFEEALAYDDVLLVPQRSAVRPRQTDVSTQLTRAITLKLPFVSAPMDTVTEHRLAIALALEGGIGIIHKNLPPEAQVREVQLVKRFENGFIEDPVSVTPEQTIAEIVAIRNELGYKKIPVVDRRGVLLGLITELDYFLPDDLKLPVKLKMKRTSEITVALAGLTLSKANDMIRNQKLWALPVVNRRGVLVSMVTRKDLEKNVNYPNATKDHEKRLRVGAAIGVGEREFERARLLAQSGVDILVVDTAHGHSDGVLGMVRKLKHDRTFRAVQVIGGNVATREGAVALAKVGADAVKVGVGPGSICTTRIVAGVGVPQLSAVLDVVQGLAPLKVPCIADGGIRYSGDIVKAIAAGANSVMMGGLFAGTDESPGIVQKIDGRFVKSYRGMGSAKAMVAGSKDRYAQGEERDADKLIPEGVEATIPYRGPLHQHLTQLVGGLRAGMGYLGAATVRDLRRRARFVRSTAAGLRESHPHDLIQFSPNANYSADE